MRIVVVGASGHGKVVAALARELGHDVLGFEDRNPAIREHFGLPVRPMKDWPDDCSIALGVGNPRDRRRLAQEYLSSGRLVGPWVHPASFVDRTATLGAGTVVLAGAVVGVDASIGVGAIVNTGASVDHDCQIGDYAFVAPGARLAGGVRIGEGTWIGMNASVLPQVQIGDWTMVGAGATVLKSLPSNAVAVGTPAVVRQTKPYF